MVEKYSERSEQLDLKQALQKVGHPKWTSLHVFRHSYAAHLLKSGPDQRYILELLGHNSSKTTERYTHASTKNLQQIHLPFDDLQKIYTLDSGKENYAYTTKSANWGSFIAPINELVASIKTNNMDKQYGQTNNKK